MSAMYRTEPGLGLKIQGGLGLSGPGFRGWGLGAVFFGEFGISSEPPCFQCPGSLGSLLCSLGFRDSCPSRN